MSVPERSTTYSSGRTDSGPPDLRLIHYNDVYHLDASSAEPVGGLSRFMTVIKEYQALSDPTPLTFFSGDAFNPSLESTITKGEHMVPVLNAVGTDVACVGNHDLDFGVRQYRSLTGKCRFPWLLANVLDPALGEGVPLGNAEPTTMLTTREGVKVGVIGLGEREWLETINSLPPDLIYLSATETAKRLVPGLREEGAEIIVCVSHMREPNDMKLARQTEGLIDIVLGGHDHYYSHGVVEGTHVLRSGTDFKQLSYIEARRREDGSGKWDFDVERRDMISSTPQHAETVELVNKLTSRLRKSLEKSVGWTAAPLDARFRTVRLKESNMGNFVCDLMRLHYKGDCALMAAGTIRGDQIYAPGAIRIKDITNCFPFEDPVVVINVTGKQLWEALENGVSLYPALEGRFPQVSNIWFIFDPTKPVGERILSARVGDEKLSNDPDAEEGKRKYRLVTRGYMGRGKDGYRSLLIEPEGGEAEEVVSEENGILISMLLRQYFMSLRVLDQWKNWGPAMSAHWDGVSRKMEGACPTITPNPSPASPRKTEAMWEQAQSGGSPTSPSSPTAGKSGRMKAPSSGGWKEWTAGSLRRRQMSMGPMDEEAIARGQQQVSSMDDVLEKAGENAVDEESDTEAEEEKEDDDDDGMEDVEKSLNLARRVCAKWCRLAGVEAKCVDEMREDEFEVEWTRAIAPRLEGRIKMIGGEGDEEVAFV
ncbi:flagellar associated protein [Zalerion maritima]|uniref:Flagellar associated protein n=1 Tax=Zalerion maritima TaxID=339359 RepID=A0AAD5RSA7_9PEZI|nr:flagellar associated protein [Zalerion maritima]